MRRCLHHCRSRSSNYGRGSYVVNSIRVVHDKSMNLDDFFKDVEMIKDDLKQMLRLHGSLTSSLDKSKNLENTDAVKELRACMNADFAMALQKAELIKVRFKELDRYIESNRDVPGCDSDSSAKYRSMNFAMESFRKHLKYVIDSLNTWRSRILMDYRETVEKRYFSVAGEKPSERSVDHLISTEEIETFLQKASIQDQGTDHEILEIINEIQERHGSARDMEKKLNELHQVFLDMAVLQDEVHGEHEADNIKRKGKRNST